MQNSAEVGAYLLDRMREELGEHPLVADIRGLGLFAAVEFAKPGSKEPAGELPMAFPATVASKCGERGMITRALWECIGIAPPLCATRAEVDEIVGILRESVCEAAAEIEA